MQPPKTFVSRRDRTPLHDAAYAALEKLARAHGLIAATDVFAEVAAPRREAGRAEVLGERGFKPAPTRIAMPRAFVSDHAIVPPATDHANLWYDGAGRYAFVSEPYQLTWNDLQAVVDHGREKGLEAYVDAGSSPYSPGHSLTLEWTKP